jgi:hypothetical protein
VLSGISSEQASGSRKSENFLQLASWKLVFLRGHLSRTSDRVNPLQRKNVRESGQSLRVELKLFTSPHVIYTSRKLVSIRLFFQAILISRETSKPERCYTCSERAWCCPVPPKAVLRQHRYLGVGRSLKTSSYPWGERGTDWQSVLRLSIPVRVRFRLDGSQPPSASLSRGIGPRSAPYEYPSNSLVSNKILMNWRALLVTVIAVWRVLLAVICWRRNERAQLVLI